MIIYTSIYLKIKAYSLYNNLQNYKNMSKSAETYTILLFYLLVLLKI